jgi:hypothetical protein
VSSMPEAYVRQIDNLPCFSSENATATNATPPLLFGMVVTDIDAKPPKMIWQFNLPPEGIRLPLGPSGCIVYGRAPKEAISTDQPATLNLGTVYSVFISARPTEAASSIRGYRAKFCLTKIDSKVIVNHIQWDEKQERWRYDVCKP